MSRKRSASVIENERKWRERYSVLYKRARAKLPPMPDPHAQPKEFHAWMRDNARRPAGWSPEEKQLWADAEALPRNKLKRPRDEARWAMIECLLQCQSRGIRIQMIAAQVGIPNKLRTYESLLAILEASGQPNVVMQALKIRDYDLQKCSLGQRPGTNGKGSKRLQDLLAILKGCGQPDITPNHLFDSIRHWRERRLMSPPARRSE